MLLLRRWVDSCLLCLPSWSPCCCFARCGISRVSRRNGGLGRRVSARSPRAFALLLGVVTARTVGWFGLLTFVPLGAVELDARRAMGASARADALRRRRGNAGRRTTRRSHRAAAGVAGERHQRPAAHTVYVAVGGTVGVVALALVGVCVVGTSASIQVMTQEYMPNRLGLASGPRSASRSDWVSRLPPSAPLPMPSTRGSALHQRHGLMSRSHRASAAVAPRWR